MERDHSKENNKFLLKCAEFQRKHWVLSLIFIRLSGLWFSLVVTYLGNSLALTTVKDGTKLLTLRGWILTILIAALIILGECSLKYEGMMYDDKTAYKVGYDLLGNLISKVSNVCKEKRDTLLRVIHRAKKGQEPNSIRIVSDPLNQIKKITNEINNCLRDFLRVNNGKNWRYQDLYVSVIYNFPKENNEWYWATEERGLSISDLMGKKTTINYLMNITDNYAFFNSKEDAQRAERYVADGFDEHDEEKRLLGSIACFERQLKKSGNNYIHYILSISSYSQKFSNDKSKLAESNTKHNIRELVIDDFLEQIDIEMCLLYLQYLSDHSVIQ